jgi:cation diffusion facilitator CzcD-associated flavoprotein CzcO
MGFKNTDGTDIKKVWAEEGIQSYLGMTMAGFPNAFMIYSPHGMFSRLREAPLRDLTL